MIDLRPRIVTAIQSTKLQVRWRPGSAARHLLKRKLRGHLPNEAILGDYEQIIQVILRDAQAKVYVYRHNDVPYVVVTTIVQSHHWLVMLTLDGLMESAYVIENPGSYLNKPVFEMVGLLNEVLG
jgi:hypothetical protein